ncbi:MAG: PorT family protein [Bacteroidales bacterium]|nr:PorT family protein [Bacteroidales bacterium]
MKKIFILVITALVGSLNAFSQINVGASMGVNFSYLIGDDRIEDATKRIGISPGIHVAFPLVYESFLEVSAIYSQQGVMIKKDDQERNFHIKYRENRNIDFMIIPITWKQQFGDFYTKLGPYVGVALDAQLTWKCDSISPDTSIRASGKKASFVNDLRQYDVGANFGLGYQTSISGGIDLFVGVDYRIGFFSIEDKNKKQINNKKLRNQVFSFSAGIYFVKNRRSKTYRHHR